MKNPEKNETKEKENIIIEKAKEISDKKDNGGETLGEKITEIKEEIKEKAETEIPQLIETNKNELIEKLREANLKEAGKDLIQRGPCQKCQCNIY